MMSAFASTVACPSFEFALALFVAFLFEAFFEAVFVAAKVSSLQFVLRNRVAVNRQNSFFMEARPSSKLP